MDLALSSQWLQSSTVPSPERRRPEEAVSSKRHKEEKGRRDPTRRLTLSVLGARDRYHPVVPLVLFAREPVRLGVPALGCLVEDNLGVPQRQERRDPRRSRGDAEILHVGVIGRRGVELGGAVGGGKVVVGWRVDGLEDGCSKAVDERDGVEEGREEGGG